MRTRTARLVPLLLLACALPATGIELPPEATQTLIHPGAWSFSWRQSDGPLAVDGFYWERSRRSLELVSTAGRDQVSGLEPVTGQMARLSARGQRPVAAVNGDFYIMRGGGAGATIGLFVREGELLAPGGGRPAFGVTFDGTPGIARFSTTISLTPAGAQPFRATRLNNDRGPNHLVLYTPSWGQSTGTDGDGVEVRLGGLDQLRLDTAADLTVLEVRGEGQGNTPLRGGEVVLSGHGTSAETLRALGPGRQVRLSVASDPAIPLRTAIGGSHVLLRGGQLTGEAPNPDPRHPRTAIGYDDRHLVAVTVDGRRPGHSVGVTMAELARLMQRLGCQEALNLDGGGSTTCWVRQKVLNRPSDGRERSVANALALLSTAPAGQPEYLQVNPAGPLLLTPGATVPIDATVCDAAMNPVPGQRVDLTVTGEAARLSAAGLTAGEQPGSGLVRLSGAGLTAAISYQVVDRLAALEVRPSPVVLLPGESFRPELVGRDSAGRLVMVAADRARWQVPAGVASVRDGVLIAGDGGSGPATVSLAGATAQVQLAVAAPVLLTDFEPRQRPEPKATVYPAGVKASVEFPTGGAASGQRSCLLRYQTSGQTGTRAAYLRFDTPVGEALALRLAVRGEGQPVWLRATLVDGLGEVHRIDLWQGRLGTDWQTVQVPLARGLRQPVQLQSVYVAVTGEAQAADGSLAIDRLELVQAPTAR